VTHSAISQQIKALEELVGLTLFVREGRGLRVSEDGRLYALQIRQALADIEHATRTIQAQPKMGELVVAVIPSFARAWLIPRLPVFQQRYPGSLGINQARANEGMTATTSSPIFGWAWIVRVACSMSASAWR
ncbi:LysR family transcriptional regulator, partial [Mycobacterium avium]|uniref:LysR family transcriptional regulator n=1 Tax=Mycobacterium avium TaxID=1764 RepID=UPI00191C85DC